MSFDDISYLHWPLNFNLASNSDSSPQLGKRTLSFYKNFNDKEDKKEHRVKVIASLIKKKETDFDAPEQTSWDTKGE